MSTNLFVILIFIINNCLGFSLNQSEFNSCISWNTNPITFADETIVGQQPSGIFIGVDNNIYVTDRENNRILIWYNDSWTLNPIILKSLSNSCSIFVTGDHEIFVDNGYLNGTVDKWKLDSQKSESVMYVNSSCTGLFIDIINNLYCSSANEHGVFKIELNMNMTKPPMIVAGTGCPGPVTNMLDGPHGIFVDENLTLFVADTNNNRIQRFELYQMNAVTVAGFGAFNTFILNRPTSIILDGNGYLFIVDSQNHRIIRSRSNGFECLFGCSCGNHASANLLNNPHTIAFDREGNIFITDFNNHRIQKFLITVHSCGTCESSMPDKIRSGETLGSSQSLVSNNNCYHIDMQLDANLVIYNAPDMVPRNPIWSSNTYNKSPYKPFYLIMQDDGNLVIYDTRNIAVWFTNTERKDRSLYHLVMQNDGNLAIYDANNHCTWISGKNH